MKLKVADEFSVIGLSVAEEAEFEHETPYGSVHMRRFELQGSDAHHTIFFIQRHSHTAGGIESGITPPHKINYKANMRALADQRLDAIVSTSSVGMTTLVHAHIRSDSHYTHTTRSTHTIRPELAVAVDKHGTFHRRVTRVL